MQNIIERIARYADDDTRRAMGFDIDAIIKLKWPPRKLPPSNLVFPRGTVRRTTAWPNGSVETVIDFNGGKAYLTRFAWPETNSTLGPKTRWQFNDSVYLFDEGNCVYIITEKTTHPDFNEDGSFKRARLEL